MTTEDTRLPVIDMDQVQLNRTESAKRIVEIFETIGFAFIDNVDGLDNSKLWESCQWFFNRSDEFKLKLARKNWNSNNPNVYRGYFPVVPDQPSRQEAFEFARDVSHSDGTVSRKNWFYEASPWPAADDESFPFKEYLQEQYEVAHNTCLELVRLCSLGLGLPEDTFMYLFNDKPCSTFRIMHFPPWQDGKTPDYAQLEDGKLVMTPEHTDTDFMTLLNRFHFKGLEIKLADGSWWELPSRPNSLVVNIGDTFSRMVSGRFKATLHRVIDIGQDRYSIPFFLAPKYDGDIGRKFLTTNNEVVEIEQETQRFGPWLLRKMKHEKKYFEYTDLPEIDD